jgi:hypothetical protein
MEHRFRVGLHAVGSIDRSVYHDAYPEGTAICSSSIQPRRS